MIAATIPWTRILRPGRVTYGQWVVDLLDFVSDNRARLVLKPASEYGGQDVWLGIETEQERWNRILAEHAERGDFVVQEYVPVPEEMFPTEDGHVQMRLKRSTSTRSGSGPVRRNDHPNLRPGRDQRLGRRRVAPERRRRGEGKKHP